MSLETEISHRYNVLNSGFLYRAERVLDLGYYYPSVRYTIVLRCIMLYETLWEEERQSVV